MVSCSSVCTCRLSYLQLGDPFTIPILLPHTWSSPHPFVLVTWPHRSFLSSFIHWPGQATHWCAIHPLWLLCCRTCCKPSCCGRPRSTTCSTAPSKSCRCSKELKGLKSRDLSWPSQTSTTARWAPPASAPTCGVRVRENVCIRESVKRVCERPIKMCMYETVWVNELSVFKDNCDVFDISSLLVCDTLVSRVCVKYVPVVISEIRN